MLKTKGFVNIIGKDEQRGFDAEIEFSDNYESGVIIASNSENTLQISYGELRTQSEPHFYFNKDTLQLRVSGISSIMLYNNASIDKDLEIIINNAESVYNELQKHGHSIKIEFACACD